MSPEEGQGPPGDFLAALAKWRKVRAPGPEHALLSGLAGDWDVSIHFHGGDEAFETGAVAAARLVHGGRFLLERLEGEMYAPDEEGRMRPEPYTSTRLLGYDRFKNAWVGAFVENQNTHLLTFSGVEAPPAEDRELVLFGLGDEPMLDLSGTTLRHVLRVDDRDRHAWEVSAMAAGGRKIFDFVYARRAER
jgi:hypothetical protein